MLRGIVAAAGRNGSITVIVAATRRTAEFGQEQTINQAIFRAG